MGQRTIITNNAIAVSLLLLLLAGCEEPKTQDDPPTIVWMTVDKNVHFPYYMELDWDILEKINGKELPPIDLGDPLTAKSFSALSSFRGKSLEGKNRLPKDIPSEKLLAFQFNFTVYSYGLRNTTHYDAALHSKLNDCETSSIRREIPEDQMGTFVDDFMQKSFTCLRREIKNVSGKIVFLGSDHGLSFFPLKLAGLSHPPQKIGLVVIDEHTDLYGLKDKGNIPSKANIFGKSLIEGDVGYVLFIGVSPHTKKEFSQSF
ncbi:MAG TPA: hypothetical protein VJB12_01555, partial [Candidatus Nanoarchaeia archaeon]|nr:hypothetical protein [Candidatus Nanoarchaeia archaeon]